MFNETFQEKVTFNHIKDISLRSVKNRIICGGFVFTCKICKILFKIVFSFIFDVKFSFARKIEWENKAAFLSGIENREACRSMLKDQRFQLLNCSYMRNAINLITDIWYLLIKAKEHPITHNNFLLKNNSNPICVYRKRYRRLTDSDSVIFPFLFRKIKIRTKVYHPVLAIAHSVMLSASPVTFDIRI